MNKKNVCFIGYGKMIQGIIESLSSEKYHFAVTSLSDKQNLFKNSSIDYLQYNILSDEPPLEFIKNADVVCFNLPPIPVTAFKAFLSSIPVSTQFIFTSSISVYKKNQGIITEEAQRVNECENKLIALENLIMASSLNYVILRLGGLYADDRHPIKSLTGKINLTGGGEFTHLVSHDDAKKAIAECIRQNISSEIINIISDLRIPKNMYYTMIANKLGIAPPLYHKEETSEFRNNISNAKSKYMLNIKYQDPQNFKG